MADLTNYAFVKDWDTSYFKENGTFKFIKPEDIEVWKKETEFKYFSVVYSGMGFMAIRKEVFDNIKYPYFDSEIVTIQADDGTVIRDICSEDVSFCKKITQAGYQIMVNTDIRVGHIKSLVI
jgi:GT2 family glycosyltransferase